jgi:hypothetical protein
MQDNVPNDFQEILVCPYFSVKGRVRFCSRSIGISIIREW